MSLDDQVHKFDELIKKQDSMLKLRGTENELCLPPVEPRWNTLEDLVRDLGCRIVVVPRKVYTPTEDIVPLNSLRGEPPSSRCMLLKSGQIVLDSPITERWIDAAHEALHHCLGPWSFRSEHSMVAIELDLVRRIANKYQRRQYFRSLWYFQLPNYVSVGDLVQKYKAAWTDNSSWQRCVRATKQRGYKLDGHLPPAYPWKKVKDYAS